MTRYVQGKDGKFAGSIGDGKDHAPTSAPEVPAPAQAVSAPAGSNPVAMAYQKFQQSHIPALASLPPREVDLPLAQLWEQVYQSRDKAQRTSDEITRWQSMIGRYGITQERIDQMTANLAAQRAMTQALLEQTEPYEAEYVRRGRWSRFFRVISSAGGHVHGSTSCSTCYPTTTFVWLPDLSGKSEEDAVRGYGSEMCSVCFPSVVTHPSYRTRGRVAEAVAAQRQSERDARAAAKAEKAITTRDGRPLKVGQGRYPETIATAVTAERTLIERLAWLQTVYSVGGIEATLDSGTATVGSEERERWRQSLLGNRDRYLADVEVLVDALAAKRNLTSQEVLDAVQAKVAAKIRRDRR